MQYAIQRLVKGLASGRKGARQGFFIALTEVTILYSCNISLIEMFLRVL